MDSDAAPPLAAEPEPPSASSPALDQRRNGSRGARLMILGAVLAVAVLAAAGGGALWFLQRYEVSDETTLPIVIVDSSRPEDRAEEYGRYPRHRLRVIKRGHSTLDFILESDDPQAAQIALKGVDASLLVAGLPQWAKGDAGLERVALAGREAHRQQVVFERGSDALKIVGGDGVERERLKSAELANSTQSAGFWEILLFFDGPGGKKLAYQGAFRFPLGRYQAIFERSTELPYWNHWATLEGWSGADGTAVPLDRVRLIQAERDIAFTIAHASASAPAPADRFELKGVKLRETRPLELPPDSKPGPEIELELAFAGADGGALTRLVVGGIGRAEFARLSADRQGEGLTVPMGIAVPPSPQTYGELAKGRPETSRRYALWLDAQDRWLGPQSTEAEDATLDRDADDPAKLSLYLTDRDRHSLILRVSLDLGPEVQASAP